MNEEIKSSNGDMEQVKPLSEDSPKKKGGRSRNKKKYFNLKLTLYLSDEEYARFEEFTAKGWPDYNYSGAARFLLLRTLEDWEREGKKRISFFKGFK